ncbi:alpha-N-acetylgalactosaminide alpha-2,6-sialyltransferase 3-like [Antedon mediterranea]|uniref:alpha-N-acetylgalactosaminide alpha-2,6-sialyltransferase 3-like n=1 Tax=Antedon mediterranea TaxID=105859 RepID=UPI003AF7FCBF
MEKSSVQSNAEYCGGRRTLLFILIVYTLLLGMFMSKYLYHQEGRMKPHNMSTYVHMQNIRNIMRLQTEKFQNKKAEYGGKPDMKNNSTNIINDNVTNNNTSFPKLSKTTKRLEVDLMQKSSIENISSKVIQTKKSPTRKTPTKKTPTKMSPTKKPPPPVTPAPRPHVLFRYKSMRTGKSFESHCKKCAIVSSSGQLLGKNLGSEIDSYPCVLRMNTAPVRGFEKEVGHKTTVRVSCFISTKGLMSTSSLFAGTGKPEKVLIWGLHHRKNAWAMRNAKALNAKYKDVEFFAQEESGETYAGEIFKQETGQDRAKTNTWLSTGWFTMMVALDMCDEIHVYGMIPEDFCAKNPGSRVKYHYYQWKANPAECNYYKSQEGSSKGSHRLMTEKAIFERWGRRYNMTFHNPSWDLTPQKTERKIETPFMKKYAKTR